MQVWQKRCLTKLFLNWNQAIIENKSCVNVYYVFLCWPGVDSYRSKMKQGCKIITDFADLQRLTLAF